MSDRLILPEYPGQYEFMVGSAPEGQVRLAVTHSILQGTQNYKNFPLNLTVSQFKQKLQLTVGTEPIFMNLELKDKGNLIAILDKDDQLLSSYSPKNGMEIHVTDTDPKSTIAELLDTTKAPKYTMTDDDYAKRDVTVMKWQEKELTEKLKLGQPCVILPDDKDNSGLTRKGTIMYVGSVEGTKGVWVGVKLEEPQGKNDGTAKGKRYFTCAPNYGVFARSDKVVCKEPQNTTISEEKKDLKEDEI